MVDEGASHNPMELAADLTAAWLANPNTRATAEEALAFFNSMKAAIEITPNASTEGDGVASVGHEPAVSVRKSLASREHIISMIDGKPYRMLTRHLSTHGLTADEYRARFKLKPDYPMVAPAYSEQRREMAKKIGLGRKPGQKRRGRAPKQV